MNAIVSPAKEYDETLIGNYTIKTYFADMRYIPGLITDNNIVKTVYKNDTVVSYGMHTNVNNECWMLIQNGSNFGYIEKDKLKRK